MTFEVDNITAGILAELESTVSGTIGDSLGKIEDKIENFNTKIEGCASSREIVELQKTLNDIDTKQGNIEKKIEDTSDKQIKKADFDGLTNRMADGLKESVKTELNENLKSLKQDIEKLLINANTCLSVSVFNEKSGAIEKGICDGRDAIKLQVQPMADNVQEIKDMVSELKNQLMESQKKQERIYAYLQMPWYKRIFSRLEE